MREPNPAAVDWRSQAALASMTLGRREAALALARGGARAGPPLRRGPRDRDRAAHARRGRGRSRAAARGGRRAGALAGPARARPRARRPRRRAAAPPPHRRGPRAAAPGARSGDRCDAAPLAERAGTELRIAGARPRRPALSGVDALTTNERRVAALAADGSSNREIAQALYVSPKTVEKHLTAAYRKLGVGGRGELRRALAKE